MVYTIEGTGTNGTLKQNLDQYLFTNRLHGTIYLVPRFRACCLNQHVVLLHKAPKVKRYRQCLLSLLHIFYGKPCRMTQHNKLARQAFHCFILKSHFIQPSECKYVLFVCLSGLAGCKYLLFRCVSDTLTGDSLSAQLI